MKHFYKLLFCLFTFYAVNVNAQRVKLNVGLGTSAYYGDLIESSPLLNQVSGAFTLGGSYDVSNKFRVRASLSTMGVKANDADNKNVNYQNRNLNFKSSIWDFNVAAEYDFLDNVEASTWTPYIFAGPGIFGFNPTTIDRFGNKQNLKEWGTEGQGLAAYPDSKPYSTTQINIGWGAGVRVDLSDELQIGTELFIRTTFTDYLDDVSANSYVDPSIFIAQGNAFSQYLSYRGDELGKPFPGQSMPRGNPNNNDLFYTFQVKLTYKLLNVSWGGTTSYYGGGGSGRNRNRMRNPRSVL